MAIVHDLVDEFHGLANARLPWEKYWREVAMYVLPQTEGFDRLFSSGSYDTAIKSVVSTPVAHEKSKNLYDMTSLWGIERLTAGMLSLKTPETDYWHGMQTDDLFGAEPLHDEKVALEGLRNYLFRVRSNPQTGFWRAHRAAIKSMCAFGDGWVFVEENAGGGARTPFGYEYMALPELFPGVNDKGRPNRMCRVYRRSASQLMERFGDKLSGTRVETYANDPKLKTDTFRVLHTVRPRSDENRNELGNRGSAFASYYSLPEEKLLIGTSGFYEYPFHRFAWSDTGARPFSEGPVAFALGEIKSENEMAKNELIAMQTMLRPAYATYGKNFVRLNLNPGQTNPGLVNGDGKLLAIPLNSGVRPDFANLVRGQRRGNLRELLYLNLWSILIQDEDVTATEALIRAQEKGELLGPVGISMNEGLSAMVDREIGILGRKRAFEEGSPLAMPDSLTNRNVTPIFTSPLDRLRRMGEVVGIQRLMAIGTEMEAVKPGSFSARFDEDEALDVAQDVLGVPAKVLRSREAAQEARASLQNQQEAAASVETLARGGEAARAIGEGGTAMAGGAEAAAQSPALRRLLSPQAMAGMARTVNDAGRPVA